jgi:hypothetical protein
MENAEPKFEKKLTTFDLPPEVGEYIKVLEGKLDLTRPRREELVSKGLDELTNQEIDELIKLNNEAVKILEFIIKSRDEKRIVKEEKEEDLKSAYKAALDHLRKELGFSPEKEIQTYDIQIGGKTKEELIKEMKEKDLLEGTWAIDLLNSPDFTTLQETEEIKLVQLTVAELGIFDNATTEDIYKRAGELGLDLCPAEVGPQLRLQSDVEKWIFIGMKQFFASGILKERVFHLTKVDGHLMLDASIAGDSNRWGSNANWVFCLRPNQE